MSRKWVVAPIAALLLSLSVTTEAQAWFRFTNSTPRTVWVAFQWYSPHCPDGSNWETAGWWQLTPGQTKTVFGADLQTVDRYYYFYAEADDGTFWAGPFQTCTPNPAFDWCLNTCNNAPDTRVLGYRELDIQNYNNYTVNLVPAPTPSPMTLDGLEVTQAIQDMPHTVTLVAGKPTWARAYLSTSTAAPVTVQGVLTVTKVAGGATTTVNSTTTAVVDPSQNGQVRPKRESITASLNFPIPADFLGAGQTTFTLTGITQVGSGPGVACTNCGGLSRTVSFVTVPPMRVRIVGLQYTTGSPAQTFAPTATDFTLLQSWLLRGYPISQLIATQTTVAATATWPFTSNQANAQLSAIRVTEVASGTDTHTHYYGMVANGGGYMRGSASGIPPSPDPTVVASGPTGNPAGPNAPINVTGDTDASFGDWYGGHELGHTFGRFHPGFCNGNSADDPSFPNPNGQISDNLGTFTGWDVGDASNSIATTVLPGAARFDIMTYCNQPQWLSAYAYEGVRTRLVAENAGGPGSPGDQPEGRRLPPAKPATNPLAGQGERPREERMQVQLKEGRLVSIIATVNLTRQSAKITYVNRVPRAMAPTAEHERRPSIASLRLVDANGKVLHQQSVWVREDTDIPADEDKTALLDAVVPDLPETAAVEVLLSGKVVDTLKVTREAPVLKRVEVAVDAAQADVKEPPVVISWEGADPDSPKLTYTVQISGDGGKTWETTAIGLAATRLTLTPAQLTGRRHGLIRVIANDGFNSSEPVARPLRPK